MDSDVINILKENLEKAVDSLEKRFTTVRTGRANPSSLDGVVVSYYGVATPLKQLCTISVPEGNQLLIKPFDKSALGDIESGIIAANLGYNPTNDGESIRIVIPALNEERRKELTKQVKSLAEDARVSIRNARHEVLNKTSKDEELTDDDKNRIEKVVQDLVNTYNKKIDTLLKEKEEELMTV